MRQLALAVAIAALMYASAFARPPLRPAMNLSTLKQQCIAYHDSGQYVRDIAAVDAQAERYLETRRSVAKAAVVLDIDETSISNYEHFKSIDFGYVPELFVRWCAQKKAKAIEPTRRLYEHARRLNMAVFFITGRRQKIKATTAGDLEAAGYRGWTDLMMAPDNFHAPSMAVFKSAARRTLQQRGYHIVANVGDQDSDLAGGYADRTFKLPNPMYVVP